MPFFARTCYQTSSKLHGVSYKYKYQCHRFHLILRITRRHFANCYETLENITSQHCDALVGKDLRVFLDVVSEKEEEDLVQELGPVFNRKRYASNHWDGVIERYKESERLSWDIADNSSTVKRIQRFITQNLGFEVPGFLPVHAIDLAADGHISPHIDSIKFSGGMVAGLSLLSSSIMRFQHESDENKVIEALLPPRSLYIMTGDVRYHFTHEILPSSSNALASRSRRVSLIFRDKLSLNVP
mmetsp:Transcript_2769/g.3940  ORF Transcript_2769/g.3940 Transcript_2769/m.3940 type:complete len:242 (-) Transcript_2769:235-960(-)